MRMLLCLCLLCSSAWGAAFRLQGVKQDPRTGLDETTHGTAFAFTARLLLTAAHNLNGGDIWVEVSPKKRLLCTLVRKDDNIDVALLSVDEDVEFNELGDDPHKDAGVRFLGSFHALPIEDHAGIVKEPFSQGGRFLASTTHFGHGCSGGPVLQGKKIVGMMVSGVPKNGDVDPSYCYFVPASALRYFAEQTK